MYLFGENNKVCFYIQNYLKLHIYPNTDNQFVSIFKNVIQWGGFRVFTLRLEKVNTRPIPIPTFERKSN